MAHPISIDDFAAIPAGADPGPKPELRWLAIDLLVVDDTYQRPIYGAGRSNVRRIATNFRWASFAPVIVAPHGRGRYAIVDGQHRVTAAALIGIDVVPCQVISASVAEQALAFSQINALVTKMSRMAIHAAAVTAGDISAVAIDDACRAADVEVLRYPVASHLQKPGQTMAVGCLAECLADFGRETLVTALRCVTRTSNNVPGMLGATVIRALCSTLRPRPAWRDGGAALLAAFDAIDLGQCWDRARREPKEKGQTMASVLAGFLIAELTQKFRRRA